MDSESLMPLTLSVFSVPLTASPQFVASLSTSRMSGVVLEQLVDLPTTRAMFDHVLIAKVQLQRLRIHFAPILNGHTPTHSDTVACVKLRSVAIDYMKSDLKHLIALRLRSDATVSKM